MVSAKKLIHARISGLVIAGCLGGWAELYPMEKTRETGELLTGSAKSEHKSLAGASELHFAVQQGNVDRVKELLLQGAQKEVQDKAGNRPLHYAAQHDFLAIVNELLAKGAHKNAPNYEDVTPLHLAAQCGRRSQ